MDAYGREELLNKQSEYLHIIIIEFARSTLKIITFWMIWRIVYTLMLA